YLIERKKGDAASADPYVQVGTSTTTSFIDSTELPDGQQFTYRVRTEFDDDTPHTSSPWSQQPVSIGAVNDAPTANAHAFSTNEDTALTTGNVLDNDTDDDSNHSGLRAVLTSAPSSGILTSNGATLVVGSVLDGSFTFAPAQ